MLSIHRLIERIGAHRVSQRDEHESDRAAQRMVVTGIFGVVLAFGYLQGAPKQWQTGLLAGILCITSVVSLGYRYWLARNPAGGIALQYLFLITDPIMTVSVMLIDPESSTLVAPATLVIIVRGGIRYGAPTMWLIWSSTVIAALTLPLTTYWRSELSRTLYYFVMLALVPALFLPLIKRIHAVRAIEEERARDIAMREVVVARSAFLAKVSHELRSPLQGIVSALDVFEMRHAHTSSDDDELINRMRRASLLLNTHLRDLLTLAKGEAGRLELRPEPFEAGALIEGVAAAARELAASRDLELVVDLPPEATFVVADGARIDQVLTNLVVNSIQYTTHGQVRVSLRSFDTAARRLRLTVADTGPGIPESMLPTLLVPDKVVTGAERRGEGSGIGLAIVRTLVDQLGGTIAVSSALGKGTTFSLEIPAEPVEAQDTEMSLDNPTGRVLVVDDREDVLAALASVVDELGFECDCASSAAVGANLLASRLYDVVLLDVDMPTKSGAEIAAETRRGNGPNRATRFIGMSAAEMGAAVRSQFDAGLTKPIDHSALRHALLGPGHGARPSQPGLWSDAS